MKMSMEDGSSSTYLNHRQHITLSSRCAGGFGLLIRLTRLSPPKKRFRDWNRSGRCRDLLSDSNGLNVEVLSKPTFLFSTFVHSYKLIHRQALQRCEVAWRHLRRDCIPFIWKRRSTGKIDEKKLGKRVTMNPTTIDTPAHKLYTTTRFKDCLLFLKLPSISNLHRHFPLQYVVKTATLHSGKLKENTPPSSATTV